MTTVMDFCTLSNAFSNYRIKDISINATNYEDALCIARGPSILMISCEKDSFCDGVVMSVCELFSVVR